MNIRDIAPWKAKTPSRTSPASLFDDLFERGSGIWGELSTFRPAVDVADREGEIEITAELPGLEEKDIDVSVDAQGLTLRGEKRKETKQEDESSYRIERSFGSFQRYIPLPSEVDRDKVKARFKNGVLKVNLPKTGKELPHGKKIEIEG